MARDDQFQAFDAGDPLPAARAMPRNVGERARGAGADTWTWTATQARAGAIAASKLLPVVGVMAGLLLVSISFGSLSSQPAERYPDIDVELRNIELNMPRSLEYSFPLPSLDPMATDESVPTHLDPMRFALPEPGSQPELSAYRLRLLQLFPEDLDSASSSAQADGPRASADVAEERPADRLRERLQRRPTPASAAAAEPNPRANHR